MQKLLIIMVGLLSGIPFGASAADDEHCAENVQSFLHSDKYNQTVVFYEKDGQQKGVWRYGESKPRPIEDIKIDKLFRSTSFKILWAQNSREGWQRQYHYFHGTIKDGSLIGSFTSDSPVMRPSPIAAVPRQMDIINVCADLVIPAEKFQHDLVAYENCKSKRDTLPKEAIHIVGVWSDHDSDGEHQWGGTIVLFKVGKTLYGTNETFEGLIGQGGTVTPLKEITAAQSESKFSFSLNGRKGEAQIAGNYLVLALGKPVRLKKVKSRESGAVIWRHYQSAAEKCDASSLFP